MLKKLNFIIALCLLSICAKAYDNVALQYWNKGNELYKAQQYQQAINNYEKIIAMHIADDIVFYNIGNAYYRNHQIGKAVLNYKRALKVNPNNKAAQTNIVFIQKNTPNALVVLPDIFFVKWYKSLSAIAGANTWAWITVVSFLLILIVYYLKCTKKISYANRWLATTIILTILSATISWSVYRQVYDSDAAVVMLPNSSLYSSADPTSKVIANIPEGTIVEIRELVNDLARIDLTNGSSGWIAINDIEKI